jgi:sRNA-binding protein
MSFKTTELLDIMGILAAEFPQAFVVEQYEPHRPLKIGIDIDLAERYPALSRVERGAFLRFYTSRIGYLTASVENTPRIDLDGNAVGTVTASEDEHAASRLAAVLKSREAKNAAAVAAKKAEREAAIKKSAAPAPRSPASSPLKRPLLRLPAFRREVAP